MDIKTIFFTQLASILVYISTLIILYRLIVEKKDATIQFLEKQLQAAKDEAPDIVLKKLNERVQIARDEVERLSQDKEALAGMNQSAREYIDALQGVITADKALIELLKKYKKEDRKAIEDYHNWMKNILEKLEEEGSTLLVHMDENGVVQKVTIAHLEAKAIPPTS